MIQGLLLAGGDSRRMGRDKARLEIQGEEAWLHLGRKMLVAGCDRVLVGVPTRLLDPLTPLLSAGLDLRLVTIPEGPRQRGSIGTLVHLLSCVQDPFAACLVAPVDHPYVHKDTLRALLQGKGPIRIPVQAGRRGHPIVLDADMADRARQIPGTLKDLTRSPDLGAVEIPVEDEAIHWNLDRPEDYDRYTARLP